MDQEQNEPCSEQGCPSEEAFKPRIIQGGINGDVSPDEEGIPLRDQILANHIRLLNEMARRTGQDAYYVPGLTVPIAKLEPELGLRYFRDLQSDWWLWFPAEAKMKINCWIKALEDKQAVQRKQDHIVIDDVVYSPSSSNYELHAAICQIEFWKRNSLLPNDFPYDLVMRKLRRWQSFAHDGESTFWKGNKQPRKPKNCFEGRCLPDFRRKRRIEEAADDWCEEDLDNEA